MLVILLSLVLSEDQMYKNMGLRKMMDIIWCKKWTGFRFPLVDAQTAVVASCFCKKIYIIKNDKHILFISTFVKPNYFLHNFICYILGYLLASSSLTNLFGWELFMKWFYANFNQFNFKLISQANSLCILWNNNKSIVRSFTE